MLWIWPLDIRLSQRMAFLYKMLWFKIKMRSKVGALKTVCFWPFQYHFKFYQNLTLNLFILTWTERSQEAIWTQKALFSVLILPTTYFEQISNENMQKLKQWLTIFYRNYWNFTDPCRILHFLTECLGYK